MNRETKKSKIPIQNKLHQEPLENKAMTKYNREFKMARFLTPLYQAFQQHTKYDVA